MDEQSTRLLEQARTGDTHALEELLEGHQGQVYRFGMKMCRNPDDAKDVLQETLLAAARGIRDFRGASSFSTWLYTIARSFCIKKRRKSKFAPPTARSFESETPARTVADPTATPEEAFAQKEIEQAIEDAIAELEPMYREVIVLRDVEGLSAAEVAEVLGIGVDAVKSRLHRARRAVQAKVAPRLGLASDEVSSKATCPDVLALFSRHLENDITADVCKDMERHIDTCAACRTACESLKRTLTLCETHSRNLEVPPSVEASVRAAIRAVLANAGTRLPNHGTKLR